MWHVATLSQCITIPSTSNWETFVVDQPTLSSKAGPNDTASFRAAT